MTAPAAPAPSTVAADVIAALRAVATLCTAHALTFDRDLAMAGIAVADGLRAAFQRPMDACEMNPAAAPVDGHVAPTQKRRRLEPTVVHCTAPTVTDGDGAITDTAAVAAASVPAAFTTTTVPAIAADADAAATVVHLNDAANGINEVIGDLSSTGDEPLFSQIVKIVNQDATTITGIAHAVLNLTNAFNLLKDRDVEPRDLNRMGTITECERFMSNVSDFAMGRESMVGDMTVPIRYKNKNGDICWRCPRDDPVTFICLLSGKKFTFDVRCKHVLINHIGGKNHMAAVAKLESASVCEPCSEDDGEDKGEDDSESGSEDSE